MSEKRYNKLYLEDILDSGKAIIEFTKGISFEEFVRDRKTQSAVIREFEIIGEAVAKLPDELRNQYPQIGWQDIQDFRNLSNYCETLFWKIRYAKNLIKSVVHFCKNRKIRYFATDPLYYGVDLEIVYKIIQKDLPVLLEVINTMLTK